MKTFVATLFVTLFASAILAAEGTFPGFFPGPVTFRLTAFAEVNDSVSSQTNNTSTQTNIVRTYRSNIQHYQLTTSNILALLENSFQTNFPAGSYLVSGGNDFFIAFGNGTEFRKISSVISWNYGVSLTKAQYTETEIIIGDTRTGSLQGKGRRLLTFKLNYDDSGVSTANEKHTKFELSGIATSEGNPGFIFTCQGSGVVQNTNTIFKGIIKGKGDSPLGF